MTFSIDGDETDVNPSNCNLADEPAEADNCSFTFKNIEIEKSGKIQFLIDVKDYNTWNTYTIDF
jgi:hypothetical protein